MIILARASRAETARRWSRCFIVQRGGRMSAVALRSLMSDELAGESGTPADLQRCSGSDLGRTSSRTFGEWRLRSRVGDPTASSRGAHQKTRSSRDPFSGGACDKQGHVRIVAESSCLHASSKQRSSTHTPRQSESAHDHLSVYQLADDIQTTFLRAAQSRSTRQLPPALSSMQCRCSSWQEWEVSVPVSSASSRALKSDEFITSRCVCRLLII